MEINRKNRLSVPEAGALVGWTRSESYRAAKLGKIPGLVELGRKLVVVRPVFEREMGLDQEAESQSPRPPIAA